ncbi:hypothetical protein [Parafrankia discariae]|uniref:hypothetical protein n=1 Tax=Parafrankia discariae TaxID=365528 RepID=UPI0003602237|nr:hypothetical protein [Parafrankia discariae]
MPRSTPGPTTAPTDALASPTPPDDTATSPGDTTIFVSRVDGAAVAVTVTPGSEGRPERGPAGGSEGGPDDAAEVTVRLRIEPPEPGRAAFTDLEPDEIRRIVDHLTTIVSARPALFRAAPDLAEGGARLTVVATEGTTAAGLRQALASVPAEARLADFVTDAEVVLVFSPHQ